MFIIKKGYEEHKDLIEFQTKYENRVNEFLNSSPETRVIFLNADFGWGKTTFIKNNLKVKEKDIYSPWLNKSNNYLEDIYYQVLKKNKGLLSSISLFISFILFFITMLFSSITSILIELNKNNSYECYIKNFKVICSTNDNLLILLKWIILIVIIVIAIVAFFIFLRPIPIINFFKKENGKYYENKLIKKILKEVDKVLVIEDIDRIDDIEEILIVANKISEYACKEKIDKYILITGDYLRMIRRIGEPTIYDTNYFNLATYRNKGAFVVEKIISLRIDFSTMQKRIDTLLEEKNLKLNLTTIEYDEIISFIKNKFLSIRFFIKFLDKYKDKLSANNNLYYLLLKYYQEEKFFNIDNSVISNSIYNIDNFPNCLNDIEMLLQKKYLVINDKKITNIKECTENNGNYGIINSNVKKLFFEQDPTKQLIFKKFYLSDNYPMLSTDKNSSYNSNKTISIGNTLKPQSIKQDLDNYLLGFNNNEISMNEGMLINKRCYFNSTNSSNNYENYKINQVEENKCEEVSNDDFICAYIAVFLRNNKEEIKKNYTEIQEKINIIIS